MTEPKAVVTAKKKESRLAAINKKIATMGSEVMDRLRNFSRAGFQYGTKRDLNTVAGYIRNPKFSDFLAYYDRNEIGSRIIEAKPKTTWRSPPEVTDGGETGKETEFTKAFHKLADRIGLWSEFEVADRRSGIGHYGIVMIGTKGSEDRALAQPLQRLSSPDDILYVRAYDEAHATIKTWVTDTGNERFGLPATYELKLADVSTFISQPSFSKNEIIVDASRVLHVAEDADDRVNGRPRLERVLNRIFDLDKISASTGESYWQAVARILQAKVDPVAELSDPDLDALDDKLAEMVHDLRRQFTGEGIELSWLGSQISPVKDIGDFYFALIAIGAGIPRRILFGNETGDLASSTDQATYFGMINERQEHFAEPQLVRAFVDRLLKLGALPPPKGGEYEVHWPSQFELTELEQAAANHQRATTAAALTPMGGDPTQLVEIDEDRNVWLVPKKPGDPEKVLPPQPVVAPPADAGGGDSAPPEKKKPEEQKPAEKTPAKNYSPDEPRDDAGKWTDGGESDQLTEKQILRDQIQDEYHAIAEYTNHGYEDVNGLLRGKGIVPGGQRAERFRQVISVMDQAFERVAPLKEDLTVYRVTEVPRHFKSDRVGAVMIDKGYASTTKSLAVAERIQQGLGSGTEILHIRVPKGTRVLDVSKDFKGLGWRREQEVILPRGSRFTVGRNYVIKMEPR